MPSSMRQAIARLMTYSKREIPHYYLTRHADVGQALARREEWNAGRAKEEQVSINDVILKAVACGLAAYPLFNSYYQDETLHPQPRINLGLAIALEDGLIAPALLDCQALSLDALAQERRALVGRARAGTLRATEYTAATFTVTNLGMYAIDSFTAIIVPPQVGILAVGQVAEGPVVRDGMLGIATQLTFTLSGDHRATDGAQGAQLLGEIVQCLENPNALFT
jgi:pyruvate dehydrogenase E2 component (dihydrolipoamide acetyltransferase)